MKKSIQLFFVLLSVTILSAACDDETVPADCIDPSQIDPNGTCITVYLPVCGCNGQT